jgi:hypothetical protein
VKETIRLDAEQVFGISLHSIMEWTAGQEFHLRERKRLQRLYNRCHGLSLEPSQRQQKKSGKVFHGSPFNLLLSGNAAIYLPCAPICSSCK